MPDDLTMWSLLVGFAAPLVISLAQQPRWSNTVRAAVSTVACLLFGVGTAYFAGDLDGRSVVSAALVVLVTALTTYRNLWKPTGVAPAIESATSSSTRQASHSRT